MKKLIIALDVETEEKALNLIRRLSPYSDIFKIGPVLFLKYGPKIMQDINKLEKKVFLDLKFHDIPKTVERAVKSSSQLGIYSLTVHISGGKDMLLSAVSVNPRPKIWGVTVLTSLPSTKEEVVSKAKLAKECNLDGVICSGLEVAEIKGICGKDFKAVVPGVRFSSKVDDQKRVVTPQDAIKNGADFIVVGREIIDSENPENIAEKIIKSIQG